MMKRKKYIDNIIYSLSVLQTQLVMRNAVGLYDDNILAEDFFCGFLNLIYGCELSNLNIEQRNTAAIDLGDPDSRIAIQVTITGSREKIQSTVDKFIGHELYKQYDSLKMLFLGDVPKLDKAIDTRGFIVFDKKTDILSIKSLVRDIRKLDIEQLRRLEAYLKEELEVTDGGRGRRRGYVITVGLGILIAGLIAPFFIRYINLSINMPLANVYAARVLPYRDAGYYASAEEVPAVMSTDLETDKAFSILSFARNYGDRDSVIEEVYCDILQLQPIEEAAICLDVDIIDNTWKLYVYNNGWGDADHIYVEDIAIQWGYSEEKEPLDVIALDTCIMEEQGIESTKVVLAAEYRLDNEKYQKYCEDKGVEFAEILVEVSDGYSIYDLQVVLRCSDGKFFLDYGGIGDGGPQITLFATLDVDSDPQRITFTGPDSTPVVGDTLRIETVIAPTKSCEIECRNVFSVNGKSQQTDIWRVRVIVPVFQDGAVGMTGMLTRELAQMDEYNEYFADRIIQKYLYEPESIREAYQISD